MPNTTATESARNSWGGLLSAPQLKSSPLIYIIRVVNIPKFLKNMQLNNLWAAMAVRPFLAATIAETASALIRIHGGDLVLKSSTPWLWRCSTPGPVPPGFSGVSKRVGGGRRGSGPFAIALDQLKESGRRCSRFGNGSSTSSCNRATAQAISNVVGYCK